MPELDKIKPTMGFELEEVKVAGKTVKLWDLSGEASYRGIWKNYLCDCDVAMILIDGTETKPDQVQDLKKVFAKIDLSITKKAVVLITKCDLPGFNPIPIMDFLKAEGLLSMVSCVDQVSVIDPDLEMKLGLLISEALRK